MEESEKMLKNMSNNEDHDPVRNISITITNRSLELKNMRNSTNEKLIQRKCVLQKRRACLHFNEKIRTMPETDHENTSDGEINAEIDRILEEDRRERSSRKRKYSEIGSSGEPQRDAPACARKRAGLNACKPQYSAVKQSKGFSLYVMEAMRMIQRQSKQASGCASACDIVNFVTQNFTNDGDIEAQVRTALRQLCLQGFTKDEQGDEYRLIGPSACQVIKASNETSGRGQAKTRNRKQCRTDAQPCHEKTCRSQESSDIDLSVPSSVKDDIRGQKKCQDSASGCRNDSTSGTAEDTLSKQIRQPPSRCSTSRRSSSGREEEEEKSESTLQDLTKNFETSATFDDDEDEYEIPEEDDRMGEQERQLPDEDSDSDDSAIQELSHADEEEASESQQQGRPRERNEARERELRRWVRNCRRECARRAQERVAPDEPEQRQ